MCRDAQEESEKQPDGNFKQRGVDACRAKAAEQIHHFRAAYSDGETDDCRDHLPEVLFRGWYSWCKHGAPPNDYVVTAKQEFPENRSGNPAPAVYYQFPSL